MRAGLVGYGSLHLLVAWISLRLVLLGGGRTSPGALSGLVAEPTGLVALLCLGLGFVILSVWQLIAGAVGYRPETGRRRLLMRCAAGCRALTYGYLAYSTLRLATHRGTRTGETSPRGASAQVLAQPFGRVLLGGAGAVVVAVGVGLVVFGARREFVGQLDDAARQGGRRVPIVLLGEVGYVAKGIAFVAIGLAVSWAAVTDDPRKTGGLDQSLARLVGAPAGAAAALVVGAGIGCFGLYLLARARHLHRRTLTA